MPSKSNPAATQNQRNANPLIVCLLKISLSCHFHLPPHFGNMGPYLRNLTRSIGFPRGDQRAGGQSILSFSLAPTEGGRLSRLSQSILGGEEAIFSRKRVVMQRVREGLYLNQWSCRTCSRPCQHVRRGDTRPLERLLAICGGRSTHVPLHVR